MTHIFSVGEDNVVRFDQASGNIKLKGQLETSGIKLTIRNGMGGVG